MIVYTYLRRKKYNAFLKYCVIIFLTINCNSKDEKISDLELTSILNKNITRYYETKNQRYLDSAYVKLLQNKSYAESKLVTTNLQLTISLLLNMKKYDELEKLLEETRYLNEYNRLTILNVVKYLKYRKSNIQRADSFIEENIRIINDSLNKKPKDSLLYADYFSTRMYLVGKTNTMKEIDSMQASSQEYSEVLYELLRDAIENSPNEMFSD